jgi:adenylate cyclase
MVEGFEDGPLGWATLFVTMTTPEGATLVRVTVVLRLEAAVWRIVQWHNSIPASNHQVFGVELTTTLHDLVRSILDGDFDLDDTTSEGTMTLVFTDIVDSTRLAESLGDTEWVQLIKAHEETIRRLTGATGGKVVKFLGDGSMLAFDSARTAIRAAADIQRCPPLTGNSPSVSGFTQARSSTPQATSSELP